MQFTQRIRKDTTVRSKEKTESAFTLIPGKLTRIFLLEKLRPNLREAESAFSAD